MFSDRNDASVAATSLRGRASAPVRQRHVPAARVRLLVLGLAVFGLVTAGCRREEITIYTVPKDKPRPSPTMAERSARSRPLPMLSWVLPNDWKQAAAGQLSMATFSITGAGGEQAEVTITPLGNLGGRDVEIVNMWREQLGLDPLSREQVENQFEPVTVAGESGRMFQIEGTTTRGKSQIPARILTAVVHRSDASWFYKLAGDASLVEEQKPAFVQFLRTLRIQESSENESADGNSKPAFNWQMPASWTQLPAGEMQVAKFAVPAQGTAKAEVFVSRFPSDTGGTLANVNRWRKQLGLGEVQESELGSMVSGLDPANPEARLVDLSHNDRRLLGAIVPRAGIYWFYKLVGDAKAVAPERDAFIRFAQSTP